MQGGYEREVSTSVCRGARAQDSDSRAERSGDVHRAQPGVRAQNPSRVRKASLEWGGQSRGAKAQES